LQLDVEGFTLAPPDQHANAQRLFVPRQALKEAQAVGVIGVAKAGRRKAEDPAKRPLPQLDLFDGR
jgi:hypothetical protein